MYQNIAWHICSEEMNKYEKLWSMPYQRVIILLKESGYDQVLIGEGRKMLKNMKRIIICCVAAILLLSQAVPVYAVGEPAKTKDLTATFYVTTTGKNHSLKVPFSPSWFKGDARVYNHNLAKLSLGLATSAFRTSKQRAEKKGGTDYNVRSFLDQAGFNSLRSDDYNKNPSMYTISTVMGHQTVNDGGESFELIAVGVCGAGYMDEWESNLSVGTGEHPEGFYGLWCQPLRIPQGLPAVLPCCLYRGY